MTTGYVEGFLLAVPEENKQRYIELANLASGIFMEFGALRLVECWGDDVPDGEVTDYRRAVKAKDGEVVVFSWIEYPDKATRDLCNKKLIEDPRMEAFGEPPFDGKRMIFAGFAPIVDVKAGA